MPKEGEEEEVEEEVEISGMAGNVVVGCMPRGVPVTIVYGDTPCIGKRREISLISPPVSHPKLKRIGIYLVCSV